MDAGDGSRTVRVVLEGDVDSIGPAEASRPPDLALVDALARLQLAARRLGYEVRLVDPCPQLCELLHVVGLADVVRSVGLALEPDREAEGREQLGVEEVVPPRDPSG